MSHEKIRERFAKLVQGDDMVVNYAHKFVSFPRFAPKLVATEPQKVRMFILKLKSSIRRIILARMGEL